MRPTQSAMKMKNKFSELLDRISSFFEKRKGLLPALGIALVLINFILSLFGSNWFTQTNLFLHAGLIIAIFGFMIAWAL
jgi:hypothetical protein